MRCDARRGAASRPDKFGMVDDCGERNAKLASQVALSSFVTTKTRATI